MKQYLSRQLWMLAILLFAGIGNAFGYKITTTIDGIPYGSGGVQYEIDGVTTWVEKSDVREIDPNAVVFLYVQSLNSVYAIKKVEINGNDITANYINGDLLIYDFGVLDKDYTVNVVFEKRTDVEIVNFTISWNTDVLPKLEYHFEPGWTFANPGEVCELVKGTYYLYFDNLSSIYSITSIKIDGQDVTGNYNENKKRIQVEADNDHDIAIEIAKTPTNTITVNWNYTDNVEVFFASNVGPDIVAVSETPCELIKGEDYWMHIYIPNSILYDITSIMVDNVNVTNDFLSNGVISFPNLTDDHEVNIVIAKAENTKNITVNWDQEKGKVRFHDTSDHKYFYAQAVTELREGSTVKMQIMPNAGWKLETLKVDGTDVTTTYNENNYYEFQNLSDNHSVNVVFAEATTYTITPTYDKTLTWVNFDNGIYTSGAASEEPCVFNAGSKVTMIMPVNSLYLTTISVDEGAYFTPEIKNERYEYVFDNGSLNSIHTVDVQLAPKPTGTVTVTWGNDCNGVDFIDENDNWFSPTSGEPETLPTGSTYKMLIGLDDPWTYRPLVTSGGNTVAATFNSNEGRYEYEIGALSQDQNLTFTVSVEQKPTRPVTVTWDYSKVKVFFWNRITGDKVSVVSGTACNLTDGNPYYMYVGFPDNDFYNLTSITVDGNDVTGDYFREYRDNGYLAFDAISADYTVSIGIKKSVETNTITVDWDADEGNVQFHDTDYNWFNIDPEDKDCELPTGNTYVMSINLNNSLVYSVGSVTVDQVGVQEYNGYEFKNLSADHSVAVVFNKVPSNNVTVTWDENNGEVESLFFCDESENNRVWTQRGNATELPINATVKLRIEPSPGYEVKTLKDGTKDVTADFVDGWYVFENPSDDHIVTIEFEKVETQKITVAYDTDHTYDLSLNGYGVGNNESKKFNKGSDVTMTIRCEDGYKPVLTIDNGNPITLDKNQDGQYKYVFSNLSTDHSVSIAYEAIIYHTITVNTNNDRVSARLNTAQNEYNWIQLGVENKFEEGEDVTLILNMEPGYALNKLMDGETDITDVYKANNYYTFSNLGSDHVVNATIDEVTTYLIQAEFDEYSQGTIYMESAMMSKRETYYQDFNVGSDVTLFVEPAIGYEVSKIVLEERDTNEEQEPEEVNFTEEDGLYKFTISGLSKNYVVTITTQKKSMAGIDPIAFTLDETGMCTYCSEYDLDFTNVSGITAYIANGFNSETGSVVMNEVDKVPAGTGLLIKGKPGNYSIPVVETNSYNTNMLTGIVKPKQIPTSVWADIKYTNFTLQSDGVFRIVNYSNNQLDAHKAYLHIPHNLLQNTPSQIKIEWGALKGDVNNDGVVDITDAVIIVNFIVGNNSNF